MLANETPEPLAQRAGLIRNPVQFTGHSSHFQLIENIRWNKPALSQPPQQPVATVQPFDNAVDRRCDRIQKIETGRIGNKNCRHFVYA